MILRRWPLAACLALLSLPAHSGNLMMVDGIVGPSTVAQAYAGWFDVDTLAWGIDRSEPTGPSIVTVVIQSSAATAALAQPAASGAGLKRIVFDEISLGQQSIQVTARVQCEEALVRSYHSASVPTVAGRAKVSLTIACGRITWEYFDYAGTGPPSKSGKGSWNFRTNTPQ
jgi:hypothetical protein